MSHRLPWILLPSSRTLTKRNDIICGATKSLPTRSWRHQVSQISTILVTAVEENLSPFAFTSKMISFAFRSAMEPVTVQKAD
jgi:hypothetical protein